MGPLLVLATFAVPIALIGSVAAVFVFKGTWWRIAGGLPLLAVAAYFAAVLIPDWARDSTSHNLFPFELGSFVWPALPYMLVVGAVYWRRHKGTAQRGQ